LITEDDDLLLPRFYLAKELKEWLGPMISNGCPSVLTVQHETKAESIISNEPGPWIESPSTNLIYSASS
jgi:hypothetical protein